jgi:hypothetical protein
MIVSINEETREGTPMIHTDAQGNKTEIKLTEVFKKRVRLYVQMAYDLPTCPSNATIKKMFPGRSNLRLAINWMFIFKTADEQMERRDVPPLTIREQFELIRKELSLKGIYESKTDTFGGRTVYYSYRGSALGHIGYDYRRESWFILMGKRGMNTYVSSRETAVCSFLANTSVYWSSYTNVAV